MKVKVSMLTATSILFDSRIQKEAQSLTMAGYSVTIFSIEDQKMVAALQDEQQIVNALRKHIPGVKLRRYMLRSREWDFLPRPLNQTFQAIELTAKFAWSVVSCRAQIFHCHDLIPAMFCWIGKCVYGAKVVYDAHELELEIVGNKSRFKGLLKWYERQMLRFSSLNITVNSEIKDIMEASYGRPVNVIQNRPYYYSPDQLDRQMLRKALTLKPEDRIVMYVGYLAADRGLDMLVLALKNLDPDVHLVVMGTGRITEFRQRLESLMFEKSIDLGRLHFVGPVPPSDVILYLCGADVSALLYQRTSDNMIFNSPNKLYQSIVANVPILASNNSTFPPIVESSESDRIGIIVDESDPDAIARGITTLLNPEMQNTCRHNLATAAVNVSWKGEERKLIQLYNKMNSEKA